MLGNAAVGLVTTRNRGSGGGGVRQEGAQVKVVAEPTAGNFMRS